MADDTLDIYGTDIAIDPATGDVIVGPDGALGTITGPDNCVQALKLRMATWPGELTEDPSYGSDFQRIVGKKYDPTVLAAEARTQLNDIAGTDARFLAVDSTTATVDGQPTAVKVGVTLSLSGGEKIVVADLTDTDFDATVALADVSLDELLADDGATDEGDSFIAQDQAEADDLRDAANLDAILTQDQLLAVDDFLNPVEGD